MTIPPNKFDLAVVGAGILGLSCALAAARRNLKVIVIERNPRAQGASVRNFGFVTLTGQEPSTVLPLARRTREVWEEVAAKAGIPILQRGVWLPAQRIEAADLIEAFLRTDMAEGCQLLTPVEALLRCPNLQTRGLRSVLWSPHELRVESRDALPILAHWLAREYGVTFLWETAVRRVAAPTIETSLGPVSATAAAVCPGDDLSTLYPERINAAKISRCTLQMLRLDSPGFVLPGTVMSDLSLLRYEGFAMLPEAVALRRRLQSEREEYFRHGIHLIIAQGADGSLVLGDSHHYDTAAGIFSRERVYELILDEYEAVTGQPPPRVRERWTGTYAVADDRLVLIDAPDPQTRLVIVTSGIGASTGFAIGEQVVTELFG